MFNRLPMYPGIQSVTGLKDFFKFLSMILSLFSSKNQNSINFNIMIIFRSNSESLSF